MVKKGVEQGQKIILYIYITCSGYKTIVTTLHFYMKITQHDRAPRNIKIICIVL